MQLEITVTISAPLAFLLAATVNYLLCISIIFKHRAKWNSITEVLVYILVVGFMCLLDLFTTKIFLAGGYSPSFSKIIASGIIFILNFAGRKLLVFPEPSPGPWKPQINKVQK